VGRYRLLLHNNAMGFGVYAKVRHLRFWLAVFIFILAASPLWLSLDVATPFDDRATARAHAFAAVCLALVTGWSALENLGDLEKLRRRAVSRNRLVHALVLAAPMVLLTCLITFASGAEQGTLFASIYLSAFGLQVLTAKLVPTVPVWVPVVVLMTLQFVLGVNRSEHAYASWASWLVSSSLGLTFNFVVGVCGALWWLIQGHYSAPAT